MTPTDRAPGILPHTDLRAAVSARAGAAVPVLDVTIPVYNEERDLEQSVRRLRACLHSAFPHTFRITVADNASTDGTLRIAERVARELREVIVVRLPDTGRGNALRTVWLASPSPVLAYMDVHLSTDLAAFPPLIAPLISGHSDLAIGTRLARSSQVVRDTGGRSSPAATTFCCMPCWVRTSAMRSAASRPFARISPGRSSPTPRTMGGMGRLSRDLASGRIPVPELRSALNSGSAPPGSG